MPEEEAPKKAAKKPSPNAAKKAPTCKESEREQQP